MPTAIRLTVTPIQATAMVVVITAHIGFMGDALLAELIGDGTAGISTHHLPRSGLPVANSSKMASVSAITGSAASPARAGVRNMERTRMRFESRWQTRPARFSTFSNGRGQLYRRSDSRASVDL